MFCCNISMWHGELDYSKLISSSGVENNTSKTIFQVIGIFDNNMEW